MHNDLIARILSYAGKKRSEVNNPCITANEAIEIANHIKKQKDRLDWMSFHGAKIGWDSEGNQCRVFIDRNDDLGFVPASGYGVWFNSYEEAIDAAMVSK